MADFTVNAHRHHPKTGRGARVEYRLYFALIFLLALPFALLAHFWAVVRHARAPAQGPVARACAEAHAIAPMIFRG